MNNHHNNNHINNEETHTNINNMLDGPSTGRRDPASRDPTRRGPAAPTRAGRPPCFVMIVYILLCLP